LFHLPLHCDKLEPEYANDLCRAEQLAADFCKADQNGYDRVGLDHAA
jgi:hypothetical protein